MKRIGHNSKVGCVLNVDMKPEVPWDRSVYGHALTNHGSTWNLDGRYFDGVDDYIDCGNSANLFDPSYSNISWKVQFKTEHSTHGYILDKINTVADFYRLSINEGKLAAKSMDNGSTSFDVITNKAYNNNIFHCITIVRDSGNTLYIHMDNIEIAKGNDLGTNINTSSSLKIGGIFENDYFKGVIKSTKIYNYTHPLIISGEE